MWSWFRKKKVTITPAPVVSDARWPSPPACNTADDADDPPLFSPVVHQLVQLYDDGRVSVVGESYYQDALRVAVRGAVAGDDFHSHIPVTAVLVPEPDNEWDENAVRIDLLLGQQTVKVGYLPSELAEEYQPDLLTMHRNGKLGMCPARVAGGGDKYYGVYLHLASPRDTRIANGTEDPVIASQTDRTILLQNDYSCTVTGEQDHQEILSRYAPKGNIDTVSVIANLTFCKIAKGKYQGEDAIEVQIDRHRVGQLTYAMTKRYGEIVRGLMDRGLEVTCEAFTVNTPKGVQVELLMPADPHRVPRHRMTR
ncbi:HIRAN domain-containing protein [Kibdelosporangium persicum]|uniref:HIRAN domain-containing protein n=1 Tax=Kibdelosporangium persicum TaxID=2698649 RepID=A0ABX2F2V5_9PSEU|nr:HIRAN domain-containing protein [Kibdelosporangium persicum]NRN65651.1 hypothetical protein [Kibdelosporangium persicum]